MSVPILPQLHERLYGHVNGWYQRNADRAHAFLQGMLVASTVAVLVLPLRTGQPSVIQQLLHPHRPVAAALHTPPAATHHATRLASSNAAPAMVRKLDFSGETPSADAQRLAEWVVSNGDNGALNFVILDKRNAKVYVFAPSGHLIGASNVLLGYAAGDDTVPGIGKRPIAQVKPWERTTPAGRFRAEPGRNAVPEDVVWVDYEAAVSMHRVRLANPAEHRAERLKSTDAKIRRISYGCINMPPEFFEQVLWPNFRRQGGIVYVLPEVKKLDQVFPALTGPSQMT